MAHEDHESCSDDDLELAMPIRKGGTRQRSQLRCGFAGFAFAGFGFVMVPEVSVEQTNCVESGFVLVAKVSVSKDGKDGEEGWRGRRGRTEGRWP